MMTRLVLGMVFGRVLDPMMDGPEFGHQWRENSRYKNQLVGTGICIATNMVCTT